MLDLFLGSLWFFLPAGVANMAPVILTKLFGRSAPIDGGKSWNGVRILGDHKTWGGLIGGTFAGGLFFLFQRFLYLSDLLQSWAVIDYGSASILTGFGIGFGALFGDSAKSFIKRRIGVASGKPWIPFDQIDYVIGGLLGALLFVSLGVSVCVIILVSYPILHIIVNHVSFFIGLRNEKW